MSFKSFLREEITGTDGLTIYHTSVFKPKGWDIDLKNFYNTLPEKFNYLEHITRYNLHRFKPMIEKKHLGNFEQFRKNVTELKYDNGKLVGITVNIKNLHTIPEFKDIIQKGKEPLLDKETGKEVKDEKGDVIYKSDKLVDIKINPKHSYTYAITNIGKDSKGKRDFSTWKKIADVKTVHPVEKPITPKASDYSRDPEKGKIK